MIAICLLLTCLSGHDGQDVVDLSGRASPPPVPFLAATNEVLKLSDFDANETAFRAVASVESNDG